MAKIIEFPTRSMSFTQSHANNSEFRAKGSIPSPVSILKSTENIYRVQVQNHHGHRITLVPILSQFPPVPPGAA